MKNDCTITVDYRQLPLKIVFKGLKGIQRIYKLIPSADKKGMSINKDE
jgi:hypothetical protein